MAEQLSPTGEEGERLSVVRDPPPPPGYVDPLASSPLLAGSAPPGPQVPDETPVDSQTPTAP